MPELMTEPMRKKPTDRTDVGIKPFGKMVEIFTAKSYRRMPVNDTTFKISINGFTYPVPAGKRCIVPREVYELMRSCRSRQVTTDVRQAERMADVGQRTSADGTPTAGRPDVDETICDYEVELIREVGSKEA